MNGSEPGEDPRRAHHDLGGVPKFLCEAVDTAPHGLTASDRRVDALRQILGAGGIMRVDELRRGIEAIPAAEYHRLAYYQRCVLRPGFETTGCAYSGGQG